MNKGFDNEAQLETNRDSFFLSQYIFWHDKKNISKIVKRGC